MLVDVHAHLDFPRFDPDRDKVIEKADAEGITIINSGLGTTGIRKTLEIAGKHKNVHATCGLQPTELDPSVIRETIELIRANAEKIVAIGEVGLDYYWIKEEDKRVKEKECFRRFIDLSDELKLPLVIHSRNAEEDVLAILEETGKKTLLHCFGGSLEQALKASEYGHLISIPANITYSKQKQEIARATPPGSLVLETDAPYLPPVPKTRNEPVNVKITAEKIAELKGATYEEVAEKTTENAKRFFKI